MTRKSAAFLGALYAVFLMFAATEPTELRAAEAAKAAGAASPVSPPPTAAAPPTVVDARVVGDKKRTRFVADLTKYVDVAVFTLADPYRIVVDLPEVRFNLPQTAGQEGRGLFSAFRYGMISAGKSRIVLDVAGPVKIDKSFVVQPANDQPARLVIDVVPTTRKAFLDANRAYRENQAMEASAKRDRGLIARRPKASTGKLTIVLDPGHGGIDNGARSADGVLEKDVALAFAKVLGKKLEETGLYDVYFTRSDDTFISLTDRVAFARVRYAEAKCVQCALFLSVHANSFRGASAQGTMIYTISEEASDRMVAEVAAAENQSDVMAGIDVAEEDSNEVEDILFDLTKRETRNFGVVFAQNLVKELKTSTRMFKVPHQKASFKVLEAPDVPSAMIELGFMTNKGDAKLLLDDKWRNSAADAVVRAVAAYFKGGVAARVAQ